MSDIEVRESTLSPRPSVQDLLASLQAGIDALERENAGLKAQLSEMAVVSDWRAADSGASARVLYPFDEWIEEIASEVEGRLNRLGQVMSATEALQLRLLASVLDALPLEELDRSPTDPFDLAATPGPGITPESVLAGPTSDAPPHRIAPRVRRRLPIPGMEGVRYRPRTAMYEPDWIDRHAPWMVNFLASMDVDRPLRVLDAAGTVVGDLVAAALEPLEPAVAAVGRQWTAFGRGVGKATRALLSAVPMPSGLRDWFAPAGRGRSADEPSAQVLTKRRYAALTWLGIIASTGVHFLMFALWPNMQADDFSFMASELTSIEVPPEVEIPPPPQQVARPATPVMSTDAFVDEDLTIAPTTFDENPVEELPPPPAVTNQAASAEPTFTPFTVAPRVTNGDQLAALMRSEYPPALRDAGIGGTVAMWFYVGADGVVQETRIYESSGYDALDAAALAVASRFQFTPALDGDRRVPVWVQLPLTFQVR